MKKILLVGSGAREHVLAETILRSPQGAELYVFAKTKNPGIMHMAQGYHLGNLMSNEEVVTYAREVCPDFVVIGPEDPIGNGLADALLVAGFDAVAPFQKVAQLEASKSFTRDLLAKYKIPGNPRYGVFSDAKEAEHFAKGLEKDGLEFVIKADGLMGGKGVRVQGDHFETIAEGMDFVSECISKFGRVVLEEKLIGQEFSLMSFADGIHTVDMPIVQDHKRAFVDDKGPNTGGMGTYSDRDHLLPFLRTEDADEARVITQMVQEALHKETGEFYRGIMYGGFIAVKNGVRLIEYNMRFGDPEAMNTLPLLETDFLELCSAMIDRSLDQIHVSFGSKATVCKYIVPHGYPDEPTKGELVTLPSDVPAGVRLYYGSVDERESGELELCGSRAIAVVGVGDTIAEAEQLAESVASHIEGPVFYRKDIGTKKLIDTKVAMMKTLRK
ncbi:MAG: phosphoribosylamine--glycine ligase [Candidatus Peregrinibacteria bacterium]|nr:phosphoribosylamine--glycine ligase [Candidatus Peregrinibacteria bacterium]